MTAPLPSPAPLALERFTKTAGGQLLYLPLVTVMRGAAALGASQRHAARERGDQHEPSFYNSVGLNQEKVFTFSE